MRTCIKCGRELADNDLIYWKCTKCGKVFNATLAKLKNLWKQKQERLGQALLKCPGCGYGIDDGNEMLAYKCPGCGNAERGNLEKVVNGEQKNPVVKKHMVNTDGCPHNNTNNIIIKCCKCGNIISSNVKFCPECGNPVITFAKHKRKRNKLIVVCTLFLLFVLIVPISLMYFQVIQNPFKTQENNLKQKIDFESIGLSENCYTETLQLINKYYSEDFENQIKKIYIDHGTDSYDIDKSKNQIADIEREIRDKYYNIYSSLGNDNDKQIVLFGYNFSLFCKLQYEGNALNVPQIDYNENIEDYYNQYVSMPSLELVNNFCAFLTTNNIIDYKHNIYKATLGDVASSICTNIELASISLTLSAHYAQNRDITSAYNDFCDFADYYQKVLDEIEENIEYKEKFLSMDISYARKILDDSKKCYKNFADAYSRGDNISLNKYTDQMSEYLDVIMEIVDEIETNAKKYNKSV